MAAMAALIVFLRSPKLAPMPMTVVGCTARDTSSMPIYAADETTYQMTMLGLSTSELAIVVFILLLVVVAGRLPRWGEALGSYLYKRGKPAGTEDEAPAAHDASSSRAPAGTGSSRQEPPS